MCGIAGVTKGRLSPNELGPVLKRMGKTLVHRGPDEYGRLLQPEKGSGLICRCLSIVDLESGKPPLPSKTAPPVTHLHE